MKEIRGLILCDWHGEQVEVHVRADLKDGELTISGQDLGARVEEAWGDSDYEYCYCFNKKNTDRLFSSIHGEDDPEATLLREFSGEGGCRALREVCENMGSSMYSAHMYEHDSIL